MPPGVPQRLLNILSKYSKKEQDNLLVSDLVIMCKSMKNVFPQKIANNEIRKFAKANNLNPFGYSSCDLMVGYIESLN
jgi:hypothetical protein